MSLQRLQIAPDPEMLVNIINRVRWLGAAFYFTRERRYAQRLVQKMRTFFLDEGTGMLPSMAYAGIRPGIDKIGRPAVCA